MEKTLAIIKPDAFSGRHAGEIISMIEQAGFTIRAARVLHLTEKQAQGFYAVHRDKPFFGSLVKFMTEGLIMVMALEREDAIKTWREVMGATNPANAADGTIRKRFGASIERNAAHGSDAPDTAQYELGYFFPGLDLV